MSFSLITDVEKLNQLGWGGFVATHPEGTVFQSPDMYELFQKSARMKPVVLGVIDTGTGSLKGILLAVIIRELSGLAGYFSSRTVIYGGPLIDRG
ncbi:MAG: aminoacyltransferase, partial [Bacteroidales bacterium]|nr:aminoacyltransferase [Bacteroidales bacterium]